MLDGMVLAMVRLCREVVIMKMRRCRGIDFVTLPRI